MKKAVFFDLNKTLVDNKPTREDLEYNVLSEKGYKVDMDTVLEAYVIADEFFYNECARLPLVDRTPEEKFNVYYVHQQKVLSACGVEPEHDLAMYILKRYNEDCKEMQLFDDAEDTLKELRKRGIKTGLISNSDTDIAPMLQRIGLSELLDYVVTSADCGATKPNEKIFLMALSEAGVSRDEALYVGDQVDIDVAGAKNAGIDYLLIDRPNFHKHIKERRICEMREVLDYI